MARLFGWSAVLLGSVAWPVLSQEFPTQRSRISVMPSPTPTQARDPGTARIRRSPVATPSPEPSAVYVQEAEGTSTPTPTPRESRPVRDRRGEGDALPIRRRGVVEEAPPEDGPVRRRRMEAEVTPTPPPVRVRRNPYEDTATPTPIQTDFERRRRIPIEATPPPREPAPVRVRRTPYEDNPTPTPSEFDPERRRRIPIEATPPPSEPTPVRRRRSPYVDTPPRTPVDVDPRRLRRVPDDVVPPAREPTPVRTRRVPYAEPIEAMPVRTRQLPIRTVPVAPEPIPTELRDASFDNGPRRGCGIQSTSAAQTPMIARLRAGNVQDVSSMAIVPPPGVAITTLPETLTLRPGSHADMMRSLPVMRQIPAATVRGSSFVTIGKTRVDFKPMVQNPKALVNIAQRLRGLPDQVEICADILEAMEVKQGLVVRSLMTYRILPGACRDEARRSRLARSGVECFRYVSAAQREAAFADPRDPHFVRDARQRQLAIAASRQQAATIDGELDKYVTGFRGRLDNPSERATIAAEIGQGELARLEGLDDAALAGELANAAETSVEQVAFIPSVDLADKIVKPSSLPPGVIPPVAAPDIDYDIGRHVFLTGFTLGKKYEWKQRVQTTIKWCFVGCKETYYAELFAGFEYGFGLRFPIEFGGSYNPTSETEGKAKLTVKIAPIDGSAADYRSTGLVEDKVFDGKELVAQFSAHAGASAKLPLVGTLGPVDVPVGMDFTKELPAPLANGQFVPPTPGVPSSEPEIEYVFENIDLIGGRANFGVAGGKLLPAVRVRLNSEKLNLKLVDKVSGDATPLTKTGQVVKLGIDPEDQSSSFRVENPVYNLGFTVTPGLTAQLFIDLSVWSNKWNLPIWFPELAITLPPGGADFACHSGTKCALDFRFNSKGAQSEFEGALEKWAKNFDPRWEPQCLDETCEFAIRFLRQSVRYSGLRKLSAAVDAKKEIHISVMQPEFDAAEIKAKQLINDSLARKSQALSNSWGVIAQAYWTKQCKDSQCYDEVKALAAQMGPRAKEIAKLSPGQTSSWVSQQVNKEFAPRFQQAVDESGVREATATAFEQQRQLKKQKLGKGPKYP